MVGSKLGFFRIGRTIARLCANGRCPDASEALINLVRMGANAVSDSLTNQVGTKSSSHDLLAECLTRRIVSSIVNALKTDSPGCTRVANDGGTASSVDERTSATLAAKKDWKVSADIGHESATTGVVRSDDRT